MRKNIYIIIGEGQSGKSSLIRALTGVFRSTMRTVQFINGEIINLAIWTQSAQEATPLVTPTMLLERINNSRATNALIALRPGNATDYINLIAQQHNIVQVVFIGWAEIVPQVPTPGTVNIITQSRKRPVNANAAMVRNWWGWM
jgi:ABC-type cobalamin/Fe3+-siderophores transport system ATPase subunit